MGNVDRKERVLLLIMSVLPAQKGIETYTYDNSEEFIFKGISQLEAGTKYYLQKLAKDEMIIDRIVVIASRETLDKEEAYGTSAINVYKKRISEYIAEGYSISNYDAKDEKNPDIEESRFLGKELYKDKIKKFFSDDENNTYFFVIDEQDRTERLFKARERILSDASEVELYMDMQGGDRNDIPLFNTILELLADSKVRVIERVATKFSSRNTIQPMESVDGKYRSFDLVTAYQIFKNYGYGDQLVSYFTNPMDKAIAESIKEISDSIKLCDVGGFDKGLDDLAAAIQNREIEFEDTEMGFILGHIKNDFKDLLEDNVGNNSARLKYVKQIRWCIKKNFVQQAVTIFESKMPTEIVLNGIDYYCTVNDDRNSVLQQFENIYNNLNEKYKMKDINHYWIKDFRYAPIQTSLTHKYGNGNERKTRDLLKDYRTICNRRNEINHAVDYQHSAGGFFEYMKEKHPEEYTFRSRNNNTSIISEIIIFLDKFEEISNEISEEIKNSIVNLA